MVIHILVLIVIVNEFIFTFNPKKKRFLTRIDKLLLLFVLLTFFSIIAASSQSIDHNKRILLFYAGVFQPVTVYFIMLYLLNRNHNFIKNIFLALLLTTTSAGIVAVIEINEIGLNLISIYLNRNEIGFGYRNTNLFGMHTALLFPIFLYTMHSKLFSKIKLIVWFNFLLLTLLSVLTLNRGTFIVIVFYLFILVWRKENRKIVLGFFIVGIVTVIYFNTLILLYINRFVGGNATQSTILGDASALYRIEIWKFGLRTILENPLGIGGTGFINVWKKYGTFKSLTFVTPHQLLLYIGVDYGIPALIAFIVLFVAVFKSVSKVSELADGESKNFFYRNSAD